MSEDRSRILNMLAEGKITAEEAERLLDALEARAGASTASTPAGIPAKSRRARAGTFYITRS